MNRLFLNNGGFYNSCGVSSYSLYMCGLVTSMLQSYAYLRKKLLAQPIFLALDNVQADHKSIQIAQTYLTAGFGPGTIVLVTARSPDLLNLKLNLDETNCLEMPELKEDEARSLFLNFAMKMKLNLEPSYD